MKGNKQRVPTTPQTASLARLAANVNRSSLGSPPPVPFSGTTMTNPGNEEALNALPLPPRDRSKQHNMALKQHQRKYPLLIPVNNILGGESNGSNEAGLISEPALSTFRPNIPVLRQVHCPEPPPNYINNVMRKVIEPATVCENNPNINSETILEEPIPSPPPKPNRAPP